MPFRKQYLTYDPENKSKHLTVSMSGESSFVGGNLSSRQAMSVIDSEGHERKGFFTANSYIDEQNLLEEQLEKKHTNWNEYRPLLYALNNSSLSVDEMYKKLSSLSDKSTYKFSFLDIAQEMLLNDQKNPESVKAYAVKHNAMEFLDSLGIRENIQEAYYEDPNFWEVLHDYTSALDKVRNLSWVHNDHQKQTKGTSINLRNNAMSDYATLLGMPGAVAKSVPMTVIRDGMVTQGSFMDKAEGFALTEINKNNPEFSNRKIEFTGDAVREMSNVHILDFLCANVDRHWQNMFYKFDFSEPGKAKLVGIQGIDNDASFGVVDFKGKGLYDRMPKIEDIKIIDDDTARRVLMMKPEEMEEKVRLAGLSKEEIKAAGDRLRALQSRIKSGSIKRISTKEDWNNYAKTENIKRLCTSVVKRNKVSGNVFDEVNAAVSKYNTKGSVISGYLPETPDAKLENTAKYDLWNQIDQLQKIRNDFNKNAASLNDPGIDQFKKQLNKTIRTMSEYSDKNSLSEDNRAAILSELHTLGTAAAEFAANAQETLSNLPENLTKAQKENVREQYLNMINTANNIKVISSDFTKRVDPAEDNVFDFPEIHSEHTYQSLHARVSDVTSYFRGKSAEFTELRKALEKVNGIDDDPTMTNERRHQLYDNLADAADRYLSYKIPNGSTVGLSDFAASRVQFARDVLQFSESKLDSLVREETEKKSIPTRDMSKKGENPYTPVIYGEGDAIESAPDGRTFYRFKTDGMTPKDIYRKRIYLHSANRVSDEDIQNLIKLNPGKDINKIFEGYNNSAQTVANGIFAKLQAKAAEFDNIPAKKPEKESDVQADNVSDDSPVNAVDSNKKAAENTAQKSDKAKKDKSFDKKAMEKAFENSNKNDGKKSEAPKNVPNLENPELETIEEADDDEEVQKKFFEEELRDRSKQAYDTLKKDNLPDEDYREAVSTLVAIHNLYQYEKQNQILDEIQLKEQKNLAKLRKQMADGSVSFDKYVDTIKNSAKKSLGKSEQKLLFDTILKFRDAEKHSIADSSQRAEYEEEIVSEYNKQIQKAQLAKKTKTVKKENAVLHSNAPSFAAGQKYISEQRDKAYNILASHVSEAVKDEARITIATCHSLISDSKLGKTVQDIFDGKVPQKNLDPKTVNKVNNYIDAVKAIGKNSAEFSKYREITRQKLAPFLCTNDPSRKKLPPLEGKCVNAQFMKLSPQERYSAESALVNEIKTQAASVKPEPAFVQKYLSMFTTANEQEKKQISNKSDLNKKQNIPVA